uniref:Protein kinase domain-containing protein n=1 Tax=Aplanochytrium stocchinoi TaxID=215587 RepID=A0A7S3PMJ4_9STRA
MILCKASTKLLPRQRALDEFNLMREVRESTFITKLYDSIELKHEVWGVMELSALGSLENFAYTLYQMVINKNPDYLLANMKADHLKSPSEITGQVENQAEIELDSYPLPEVLVRWFIAPIVLAVKHCHEKGIVHLDIKQDNILLFNNGVVKLTDFGSSMKTGELPAFNEEQYFYGTPGYQPPENFKIGGPSESFPPVDPKVDVWSIGVTALDLFRGKSPWRTDTYFNILFPKLYNDLESADRDGVTLRWELDYLHSHYLRLENTENDFSDNINSFVKYCLKLQDIRPDIDQLCKHAYLEENIDYWMQISNDGMAETIDVIEHELDPDVMIHWELANQNENKELNIDKERDQIKKNERCQLETLVLWLYEDVRQKVRHWFSGDRKEENEVIVEEPVAVELKFLDSNNPHSYHPQLIHSAVLKLIAQCLEFNSEQEAIMAVERKRYRRTSIEKML